GIQLRDNVGAIVFQSANFRQIAAIDEEQTYRGTHRDGAEDEKRERQAAEQRPVSNFYDGGIILHDLVILSHPRKRRRGARARVYKEFRRDFLREENCELQRRLDQDGVIQFRRFVDGLHDGDVAQPGDAVRLRLAAGANAGGEVVDLEVEFLHRLVDFPEPFRADLAEEPSFFVVRVCGVQGRPAFLGMNLQEGGLFRREAA